MMPAVTFTGLRERLRRREPLAVAFLDLGSPVTAEITARSGFDVVVVDLEHGAGDEGAARAQIQAADAHAAVVVRTPEGPAQIGRMLDAGASGVIVPQVADADHADRAANAVRYAGTRGISPFSRGNRYGQAGRDFRANADAALACIVQIERASALEAVDAIAALPDVDALLMGPADLSADLGCALDLDDPQLRDAARRIGEAAERHGKTAALHLARADQAAAFRELGFTMLSCTFESAVLATASAAAAQALSDSACRPT
jgi:2-keto-3-deoxy-L-rhamnonate aldolase RhmA